VAVSGASERAQGHHLALPLHQEASRKHVTCVHMCMYSPPGKIKFKFVRH